MLATRTVPGSIRLYGLSWALAESEPPSPDPHAVTVRAGAAVASAAMTRLRRVVITSVPIVSRNAEGGGDSSGGASVLVEAAGPERLEKRARLAGDDLVGEQLAGDQGE